MGKLPFNLSDILKDMQLARSIPYREDFANAVAYNHVVIRTGLIEYEGQMGRTFIFEFAWAPGYQVLIMPIIVDDNFYTRNKELFKYPWYNNKSVIIRTRTLVEAVINGTTYEFDFGEFDRYGENLMALWLATGGAIYHPLPALTFLTGYYLFNKAYDPHFIKSIGDTLVQISTLDVEALEKLVGMFKTRIFKSIARNMLCIRRELRLCPPSETNE